MKIALIVLDGWGIAPKGPGNCIELAKPKFFWSIEKNYPHTSLDASGTAVGLPKGAMGTSEVGHLHIGAGRIVKQPISFIDEQIKNKKFFENQSLKKTFDFVKKNKSSLHIMGLCSDKLVHSSINHLFALLEMAKKEGQKKVFIHFFADGRDAPEKSALKYVGMIEKKIKKTGIGKIASVVGRYYAMDRDSEYSRTKKAYDLLTLGTGRQAESAKKAIELAYKEGDITDYYIEPTAITKNGKLIATINDNDAIIFFNTRTDRIRQIIKCFVSKKFSEIKLEKRPKILFCSFVSSDKEINEKELLVAFDPFKINNNLGTVISKAGLKQLRIAETDKFHHVTYFFNSQEDTPLKNEERIAIPSEKVPVFDQKPEMSARQIKDTAINAIKEKKFDFILVNFANADLVGHSANIPAIIKGVQTVDNCLAELCQTALENNYGVIVTADHGNAEEKLTKTGEKIPSHSTNKVPFIIVAKNMEKIRLQKNGGLKDVAPTILELMKLDKPPEMTGKSLIKTQNKRL